MMLIVMIFVIFRFVQCKPMAMGWMHHISTPEDMMFQLFSLQRRRTNREHEDDSSAAGHELLQLMLSFNANSNYEDSSEDGGDADIHEDFFS